MKKLALILLLLFCLPTVGVAKVTRIEIDFAFESSIEVDIDKYTLYFTYLDDTKVFITDITDLAIRTFTTPEMDLPVGKTIELYLSATYKSGVEAFSDPFPYKIIGKPTITGARSVK